MPIVCAQLSASLENAWSRLQRAVSANVDISQLELDERCIEFIHAAANRLENPSESRHGQIDEHGRLNVRLKPWKEIVVHSGKTRILLMAKSIEGEAWITLQRNIVRDGQAKIVRESTNPALGQVVVIR